MKDNCLICGHDPCCCPGQREECQGCEHPEIAWCVDCCLRCKRLDKEIARLKAELAEAQYDGRNALGLRLLLKPGEWKRRMESEPDADTRDLGQDVAMLVLLMRNQRRELADLRRMLEAVTAPAAAEIAKEDEKPAKPSKTAA